MYQTISMSERLRVLGRRPLFTVDGMTYSWGDALAWAAARGSLDQVRESALRGLTALAESTGTTAAVDPEELSASAARFRYRRRLLSAEELDDWLRRWGLTVSEWGGYLERSLLLERGLGYVGKQPDDNQIAEAEFVDAVCSGLLEREALGFAADTALANLTPVEAAGDRDVMIERTMGAAALARAGAVSESSLEREIARRGLDWTRLEVDVLELPEQGAAREAALCIRLDGRAIADVAAECQGEVSHMSVYLGDLEPSLQPSLLAAQPGELVGPVEEHHGFVLLAVNEREPAAATDPELRRRAEAMLVDRLVRRATEGRVEWHERL